MKRRPPTAPTTTRRRPRADRELAKQMLALLQSGSDARVGKIKQVRQKVRARSYENDLKLSIAVDRLIGATAAIAGN